MHALRYYPPRMHGCPNLPFRPFPDRPNGAALLSDPDLPAVINVHISTGAVMTERAWCGLRTEAGPALGQPPMSMRVGTQDGLRLDLH